MPVLSVYLLFKKPFLMPMSSRTQTEKIHQYGWTNSSLLLTKAVQCSTIPGNCSVPSCLWIDSLSVYGTSTRCVKQLPSVFLWHYFFSKHLRAGFGLFILGPCLSHLTLCVLNSITFLCCFTFLESESGMSFLHQLLCYFFIFFFYGWYLGSRARKLNERLVKIQLVLYAGNIFKG